MIDAHVACTTEIAQDVPVSDVRHPRVDRGEALRLTLWSQFARFVLNSPADFEMLTRLEPEPGSYVA